VHDGDWEAAQGGQATYYERYQRFPTNQRMFVENYLANPEIAFINPNL
jgi:hypothetical protein